MITTKSDLKEALKQESKLYGKFGSPVLVFEKDILHRYFVILRKAEYYTNSNKKIRSVWYKIRLQRLQNKYALRIPINTCDIGLSVGHVGPIIINQNARLGKNVRIHVGAVIGANGGDKAPQIGNNVYIGPGAKVFGDIKIADGCKIGANAVVNKSCDIENALLVGIPAVVKNTNV